MMVVAASTSRLMVLVIVSSSSSFLQDEKAAINAMATARMLSIYFMTVRLFLQMYALYLYVTLCLVQDSFHFVQIFSLAHAWSSLRRQITTLRQK